jgi:hypothetical protein
MYESDLECPIDSDNEEPIISKRSIDINSENCHMSYLYKGDPINVDSDEEDSSDNNGESFEIPHYSDYEDEIDEFQKNYEEYHSNYYDTDTDCNFIDINDIDINDIGDREIMLCVKFCDNLDIHTDDIDEQIRNNFERVMREIRVISIDEEVFENISVLKSLGKDERNKLLFHCMHLFMSDNPYEIRRLINNLKNF